VPPPTLVAVQSPYRLIVTPIMDHILEVARQNPNRRVAVLIPEYVKRNWYDYLLQNNRGAALKALLLVKGNKHRSWSSTSRFILICNSRLPARLDRSLDRARHAKTSEPVCAAIRASGLAVLLLLCARAGLSAPVYRVRRQHRRRPCVALPPPPPPLLARIREAPPHALWCALCS
jgi:hypothetical protein